MKKLALTTLLAAGILLSGCQAPGEQSPEVTSVQTQAVLQTAAEPELPPTLDEKPERFTLAEYPCTTDNLRIDGNDPWLFDFRYSAACGFGKDGTYRDAEMYYGLKGELSSTQLSYWFYDYDLGGVTVKSAQLVNDSSSRDILLKEKAITINTKELDTLLHKGGAFRWQQRIPRVLYRWWGFHGLHRERRQGLRNAAYRAPEKALRPDRVI